MFHSFSLKKSGVLLLKPTLEEAEYKEMRGAQCCICQHIYLLVRYSKVLPIQRVSDEFGYSQLTPPPSPHITSDFCSWITSKTVCKLVQPCPPCIKCLPVMSMTYSFGVALPSLRRTRPAWDTGLLLIVKIKLLLVFYRLLSHGHQVIIQFTLEGRGKRWSNEDKNNKISLQDCYCGFTYFVEFLTAY